LDNIRVKAALSGDSEVSEMIMLRADFFRSNMAASSNLVPISKELHLIRVYLSIMQYRYPNLYSEFLIDEDLLSIEMPGFILQPIVENSLIHGLKSINYNGKIVISLSRDITRSEFILIKISDNGVGFNDTTRKSIERLLHARETIPSRDDSHVGIANVDQRLKLFYSPDCGLVFEDNPSGGVTAVIKIKEQVDNLGFAQMKINAAALDAAVKIN
jgi:sensor histidine kinase YesM